MARIFQILAVLFVGLSACCGEELAVTLTASQLEVRPGDALNITCHITNFRGGSIITWYQVSEMGKTKFGENNIPVDEVTGSSDRYAFDLENVGTNEYNLRLIIATVKLEDAGQFLVVGGFEDDGPQDSVNITVRVDPAPPKLIFKGSEIKGGEVFEMEQGEEHDISCEVIGASPEVQPVIMAGEFAVSDGEDYVHETVKHVTEGEFIDFYEIKYDSFVRGTGVVFDARYANKEVQCQLKDNPDITSPAFRTKFPGMSPVWSPKCKAEFITYNGAHNVNVSCEVTADPPASVHIVWHYRNPEEHDVFQIEPGMSADERPMHYNMEIKEVDESTSVVNFLINKVKPQMFREYAFIAKNELGSANYTVLLTRDVSMEASTSKASHLCSLSLALLLSALYFLFH